MLAEKKAAKQRKVKEKAAATPEAPIRAGEGRPEDSGCSSRPERRHGEEEEKGEGQGRQEGTAARISRSRRRHLPPPPAPTVNPSHRRRPSGDDSGARTTQRASDSDHTSIQLSCKSDPQRREGSGSRVVVCEEGFRSHGGILMGMKDFFIADAAKFDNDTGDLVSLRSPRCRCARRSRAASISRSR